MGQNKRYVIGFSVGCFAGATLAFAFGWYAVGAWLAVSAIASAAVLYRDHAHTITPPSVIDTATTLAEVLKRLDDLNAAQRTVASAVQAGIQPRRNGNGFVPFHSGGSNQ